MNIFKRLKEKGHRITSQRKKVLEEIISHPRTVDEIYSTLQHKKVKIDLASVYRALQVFTSNNIAQEINFNDGKKRYEIVDEHHHHAICNSCGTVEDITLRDEDNFITKMSHQSTFQITNHSLEFFGLCQQCQ